MVEVKAKQGTFDLSKYQVSASASKQTLTINETGDTFEVSVKQLTWSKRNKLMSWPKYNKWSVSTKAPNEVPAGDCASKVMSPKVEPL